MDSPYLRCSNYPLVKLTGRDRVHGEQRDVEAKIEELVQGAQNRVLML